VECVVTRRGCAWAGLAVTLLCIGPVRAQTGGSLLLPSAMAYDVAGNVYFADTNRNQVLESTLGGQLVVIAGSGVQGFAGDGGAATSAELNSPQGVAVGGDGTVYIADTGNQRVRAVTGGTISTFALPVALAVDTSGALLVCDSGNQRVRRISLGTITTIAGDGVQGFAGDGGAATAAEMDTPMGVAAAPDGRVFIADSSNNRVRVVNAAGMISTFAGTGEQGFAGDGGVATSAELAMPRGLVLMPSGALLIADEDNQRVRMVDASGLISTLQGSGVQGAGAGDGVSALTAMLNSPRAVGASAFAQPAVVDSANKLLRVEATNAALYAPAGLAPSRASSVVVSAPVTVVYGQLSASVTVSGVAGVPQGAVTWLDTGSKVGNSTLSSGSATIVLTGIGAGTHALSVQYGGDGLNPAATSSVTSVTVTQAASSVTEQLNAQSYAGLPMILTAVVSPATHGTPTGTVAFLDSATVVASANVVNGVATGTYLTPSVGAHAMTANYSGDGNFQPSSSGVLNTTVSAMPDFTVSVTNPSQSVQGGLIANYTVTVVGQGAFSGAVSLGASGLPAGASVSFSPPQLVPGAGSLTSTLSIVTTTAMASHVQPINAWWALGLVLPMFFLRRRRLLMLALAGCLVGLSGCGARTLSLGAQPSQSYAFTVTGTGTNLAGVVVAHSVVVTLVVE